MRLFPYAMSSLALVLGSCVAGDDPFAEETSELGPGAHFVATPRCRPTGTALICTSTIAGLGDQAVDVEIVAQRACTNQGGTQPPGEVKGFTGPTQPVKRRIKSAVAVEGACPGNMLATFTSPATVNVFGGEELLFSGLIEIF